MASTACWNGETGLAELGGGDLGGTACTALLQRSFDIHLHFQPGAWVNAWESLGIFWVPLQANEASILH